MDPKGWQPGERTLIALFVVFVCGAFIYFHFVLPAFLR